MTLTAATDVLVPHPAPDSVTGQLARVFAAAPASFCPHLPADLSGPVFVSAWRTRTPRSAGPACSSARSTPLCAAIAARPARGFTYAMRGRQVIAAGTSARLTAADLDQPGAVVLDVDYTAGTRMPANEPYYGVNAGSVVIRTLGGPVVLDRGEIVRRTAWTVTVRRPGGRTTVWSLLRVPGRTHPDPAEDHGQQGKTACLPHLTAPMRCNYVSGHHVRAPKRST